MTTKERRVTNSDKGESVVEIERELPPDTEAAKYWLNNRRPEQWKSSPDTVVNNAVAVRITLPDGTIEEFHAGDKPGSIDTRLQDASSTGHPLLRSSDET
jgi:hypothetical protein